MTFHVLGLLPVAALAAIALYRFGWRGLLLPALIVLAGQVEYDAFLNIFRSVGFFSWFDLGLPAVAILYARWFAFPALTVLTLAMLWIWAMSTSGVSDLASIVGWYGVSSAVWLDNL